MKKLSIALVLVLLVSLLAACNPQGAQNTAVTIPGYFVELDPGKGWTAAEESNFDLELSKDDMKLYAMGFSVEDFVDPPLVEDLVYDGEFSLSKFVTDLAVVEDTADISSGNKTILVTLYEGSENGTDKQYYCFSVQFAEETGAYAWLCFSAKADALKKNRDNFKSIVEAMTCSAQFSGSALDDEPMFDENGELIVDETYEDYEEPIIETEPVIEEPTTGTEPAEPTRNTEATEATEAATEATEATEAATISTAPANA